MTVSSYQLQALLILAQDQGAKMGLSVLAFLRQMINGSAQIVVDGGRTRVSISSGGVSTSFQIQGGRKVLSPPDIVEAFVQLWNRYSDATIELGGNPSDAQVVAQMFVDLRPIRSYTDQWAYLAK